MWSQHLGGGQVRIKSEGLQQQREEPGLYKTRGGGRNKEGSGGKDGVSRDGGEREGVTERETDEGIKNIHNLLGMHL